MGQIRVSDYAENAIKAIAQNKNITITSVVDGLVDSNTVELEPVVAPIEEQLKAVNSRLDGMAKYLKEHLPEGGGDLVDRLAATSTKSNISITITGQEVQDYLEHIEWDGDKFLSQPKDPKFMTKPERKAWEKTTEYNYDADLDTLDVRDGLVFRNYYGKTKVATATPQFIDFLEEKGIL